MTPFPLILSAPSGGGKTRIAQELRLRRADVGYSVSCTTRTPRAGERDGVDYYFLTQAAFDTARERGDLAEWAVVHGNYYGTLRSEVERVMGAGKHVIMDIDVQGAAQFAESFPDAVLVFVLPPSLEVMLERLASGGSESRESLLVRLESARKELGAVSSYQYVVLNDALDDAVARVSAIIDAESVRRGRVADLDGRIRELIAQLTRTIASHH